MKKFIAIAAAIVLFGTQAFAQLSVGAGYLNSTESGKYKNSDDSWTKSDSPLDLNGAYVGINYTIDLSDLVNGLGITPGIYASALFGKIAEYTVPIIGTKVDASVTDIALNAPVNINFGYDLTSDFKLFAFAGPIFQIGLLNNTVAKVDNNTNKTNNFDSEDGTRNRFNILIGGGLGFEVSEQIQVILGYNHSLMNYLKSDNAKAARSQITIGLGYKF